MKLNKASRDIVQVVLRDSTSISPDFSGSKRSLDESGVNLTLLGSLKIAAAIARQKSTSRPVQTPLSSGLEKPGNPWLTPQMSEPRSFTVFSIWALAASAHRPSPKAKPSVIVARFMVQPSGRLWPSLGRSLAEVQVPPPARARQFWRRPLSLDGHHRTIAHRGQGVDGGLRRRR